MNSLEEIQQTLALLQRIQGVTSALQKRVQAVSSLARGALDSVKTQGQQLSVAMDEVLDKLKSEVQVTWRILVEPTWQPLPKMAMSTQLDVTAQVNLTPKLNVSPELNITPKVNVAPELNITPKVNVAPELNIVPKLNIAPKLNVSPELNIAPKLNVSPELNIAPKLNVSPELNIAPKLNVSPELNIAPKLNVSPELNIAPKLNVSPELNITPKMNIKPELNIVPKMNIKPELNIVPKVNVKPELNFAPTLNFKPTLNIEPKIQIKPKVSGVSSVLDGLKKSFSGLFAVLRASVVGFFGILRVAVMSTLPALFAFSAALLANPITWVVLGIVALVAAIVGLIVYWDQVTAAVGRFFEGLSNFASANIFEPLRTWWEEFIAWLSSLNPFASISKGIKKFAGLFGFSFGDEDESTKAIEKSVIEQEAMNKQVALPGNKTAMEPGQDNVMQSISQQFGGQQKSTKVDKIEVHNHSNGVRGDDLMYELEMVAS
ncbi:hypothetical protein [Marinomonas sp. THO17]|uniref:hypothetical protein n=1 Tax=Marinomonas sp. THO17 TaxID=3149048 RepID=UPI00336BE6A7